MPRSIEFYTKTNDPQKFLNDFLSFPHILFSNNNKVKKLPVEVEAMYFKIHPLKHDFLLIKENEKVVLRSMVCLTPFKDTAYFGLLDFDFNHPHIDVILSDFKNMVVKWCRDERVTQLIGPVNFSTWLPYRLTTMMDGDESFFSFEPDRPLEYASLLKEQGFVTNQLFTSKGFDNSDPIIEQTKSDYEKGIALGYSFEFMPKTLSDDDIKDLHRLSVTIFEGNYLATPIDFPTFKALYVAQAQKENYEYSAFILSPKKERIGFFFNFIERDYSIAKTIGVDRSHRGAGLSNGAMYVCLKKARDVGGIKKMVIAMVKEGAQSESYGRKMNLIWTHLYELLELKL